MKHNKILTLSLTIITTMSILFTGCGKSSQYVDCPLSDVALGSSAEDVIAAEGDDYETYDSTYGGTTYKYDKKYAGADGTIKYMCDAEGELVCIAWAYDGTEDPESMTALYDTIRAEVVDKYGESKSSANEDTNNGDLWRVDGGSVMIYSMITDSNKALQYSYISSKVSGTDD